MVAADGSQSAPPSLPQERQRAVDGALAGAIAAFTDAFPGRLRAAYTLGSYSDASAIAASDLDLTLVVADGFAGEPERAAMTALIGGLSARAREVGVELDLEVESEAALLRDGASPNLLRGSTLAWGQDIRPRLALVPLDVWTRDRMHSSWWRVARLFARPSPLALPLTSPEPADAFRGYLRRPLRLPDGREVPCTRDLIRLVGWAATGLLALQCGVYVARKGECHTLYATRVGGGWGGLVTETYTLCRTRWGYRIPDAPAERARLRDLCDRTLGFEQAFTDIYRRYLLGELASGDARRVAAALEAQAHAPMADAEVAAQVAATSGCPSHTSEGAGG